MQGFFFRFFAVLVLGGMVLLGSADVTAQENPHDFDKASSPKWVTLFMPRLTYSFPTGDGYQNLKGGIGYEGTLLVAVSPVCALGFSGGKSGVKKDSDQFADSVNLSIYSFDVLLAGYKYFTSQKPEKGLAYMYVGVGSRAHTKTGTTASYRFAIPFGLSVVFGISRTMAISLSGQYTIVTLNRSPAEHYPLLENGIFDIKAGIALYIPALRF